MYINLDANTVFRDEKFGGIILNNKSGQLERLTQLEYIVVKMIHNNDSLLTIYHEVSQLNCSANQLIGIIIKLFKNSYLCQTEIAEILSHFLSRIDSSQTINLPELMAGNCNLPENNETNVSDYWSDYPLKAPLRISLQVTANCNLKCWHCYSGCTTTKQAEANELSYAEIIELIDTLASKNLFQITITGGEPLLRDDTFSIIEHCLDKNISVMLDTNGTLMSSEKAKALKKIGLKYISMSLDGFSSATHNLYRGVDGAFNRTIEGLKELISAQIENIRIQSIINNDNLPELSKLSSFLDTFDYPLLHRFLRLIPIGNAEKLKDKIPQSSQIFEFKKHMQEISKSFKNVRLSFYDSLCPPVYNRKQPCDAGILWCAVNSHGFVMPCTFFDHMTFAEAMNSLNIRHKNILEIWESDSLFNQLRGLEHKIKGKCKHCASFKNCAGGCRASAYSFHKDIFDSDSYCNNPGSNIEK